MMIYDTGFSMMDSVFPVVFFVIFALVICLFAASVVKSVKKDIRNDNAPRLTVHARVTGKRQETRGSRMVSTDYFATFEVESGDRMELEIEGEAFGLLAEGDEGTLTFQGTRYVSFERDDGEWN